MVAGCAVHQSDSIQNAAPHLLWSSVRTIIFASRPVPGLVSRKRAGVVFGTCSAMSMDQKLSSAAPRSTTGIHNTVIHRKNISTLCRCTHESGWQVTAIVYMQCT